MAVGIALPWRANKRGGLFHSTSDDTIKKLLGVALGNNDSNNPFQELGLDDIIFDPGDETTFGVLRSRIEEIFEGFREEEIAALQTRDDNLAVTQTAEGEFQMNLFFVNLETDLPGEATVFGGSTGLFVR